MQYLATYLIYIAVIARAIGWNHETFPLPTTIWILLAIFGALLFSERALTQHFPLYPRVYTLVQSGLVIAMLYRAPTIDFLSMLLMPLSFQAVQFFHDLVGFICIGVFSLAMAGMMLLGLEWQAGLTMLLATTGANLLMGSFAHLMARTEQKRLENQRLFGNLQQAYRQLKDSTAQAEALSAAKERHHLARELHDSLTQTLFSMNLAVQSAQFALTGTPLEAEDHLTRLQALAHNAVSEVQALTGQVNNHLPGHAELSLALQELIHERLEQDGLQVTLQVTGKRTLPVPVQANLYRITQEALNNISRHSGVRQAQVTLDLDGPYASLEIVDEGCGFDLAKRNRVGGFGLAGMAERASEIGWKLYIQSQPGRGTRIRAEERLV
jgi:signal transduction histidine kinase